MSFAKKFTALRSAFGGRSLDRAIRDAHTLSLRDELVLLAQRAEKR